MQIKALYCGVIKHKKQFGLSLLFIRERCTLEQIAMCIV